MTYTNSFHHGTERRPGHNRRTLKGEAHIDPNGKHETWTDEDIGSAYDRIFGEALLDYNAKQKRKDRRIQSYLQNVRQNSKLHDSYEFVVQVGNENSHPSEKTCHAILKAYFDRFRKRNPGLEVIGAYYHADEVGGCPHLHVDYIPVAKGKKTGLKVRNNLNEALKALGYETEFVQVSGRKKMVSAEMKFQEAERAALTQACRKFGVQIENPKRSKSEYCSSKQLRQARDMRLQNSARAAALDQREKALQTHEDALQSLEKVLADKQHNLDVWKEKASEKSLKILKTCKKAEADPLYRPANLQVFFKEIYQAISGTWKAYADLQERFERLEKEFQKFKKMTPKQFEKWHKINKNQGLERN